MPGTGFRDALLPAALRVLRRGPAGQRAAVACPRIGKIVLRPATRADACHNHRQRGSLFGAGRTWRQLSHPPLSSPSFMAGPPGTPRHAT